MAQAGPKEWYDAIPPVSRAWFTGAVAVGVAGKLGMLNAMILLLNLPPFGPWMVDLVWKKSQVGVGPGCGGCRVNPPAPMRAPLLTPPPPLFPSFILISLREHANSLHLHLHRLSFLCRTIRSCGGARGRYPRG